MATGYTEYPVRTATKDYTRPLHVDCSVEYELPNAAKPPAGTRNEPLLMIHPCYYRQAESRRRSPFVNNLPQRAASRAPPPVYPCKGKRDPLLCGDFSSSADSGVSLGAGHWGGEAERSPLGQELRLHHAGPDSGIAITTPGTDENIALADLLSAACGGGGVEVNNNQVPGQAHGTLVAKEAPRQPQVGVAAVSCRACQTTGGGPQVGAAALSCRTTGGGPQVGTAAVSCRACQTSTGGGPQVGAAAVSCRTTGGGPQVGSAAVSCRACQTNGGGCFLQPQQRAVLQQPWPGMTAPNVARFHPDPHHPQQPLRRPLQWGPTPPAKKSRKECCKACQQQQWSYPAQCALPDASTTSRMLWNNDTMLRLFQV